MSSVSALVGWLWIGVFAATRFHLVLGFRSPSRNSHQTTRIQLLPTDAEHVEYDRLPRVWIQEAEEGFVDADENLEEGEECLLSLKAFASNHPDDDYIHDNARFLCAGALVKRPGRSVCDAWTADAILDEGGPNLQLQGALKVLDALLLEHLTQHRENSVLGLQTFCLRCGSPDSDYTCSSYMAARSRCFRPLQESVRVDSIYSPTLYDNDLEGMVFDPLEGKIVYKQIAHQAMKESPTWLDDKWRAISICKILPSEDMIKRCTNKRFTAK